jgi:antitoxin (DNA-binding transcriptional repressor) of toxin-antitoxin stability system
VRTVSIKELKNRLSEYLREVRAGELVLVTDRGRVVAELRQPSRDTPLEPQELAIERMVAAGLLVRGLPQDASAYGRSPLRRAVASADLLDAERGRR